MKTTPSQPAPAPAPGRRAQPVRQTRTNPARSSTRANGASRPSGDGPLEGQKRTKAPGFLPAITHFTDAITALPKEVVRHFGLLKEVDAKLYGPENTLRELTEAALNTPAPSTAANAFSSGDATASRPLPTGSSDVEPSSGALVATGDQAEWRRRELFFNLRVTLTEILVSLDEKNHVISTATQALQKQLARCESSYGSVGNEISDEARYGSLSHWAYAEKPGSRTNGSSNERPRREVANASSLAGLTSEEMVASRSESRREAMAARRSRLQPAEPAVQDSGPSRQRGAAPTPSVATATATATTTVTAAAPSKKGSAPAKSKKAAESAAPLVPSTNTASPSNHELHPNKRRRTEKAAASRAASGAAAAASPQLESSETGHGGARAVEGRSPRSTPAADGSKKRVRSGAAATTTANARRRTNNNNNNDGNDKSSAKPPTAINSSSSINNNNNDNNAAPAASPSLASSPVQPNFPAASKNNPGSSPLLQPTQQRPSTGRGRQDSGPAASADVASGGRRRPSSLTSNQLQAANDASTAVHDEPGPTTAKTNVSESKSSAKAVAKPAKDLHLESKNEGGLGETSKGGDGGGGSPRRPGSAKTKENVSRATGETDDDDGLSKRGASAGVSNKNPTSINTGTAMPRGSSRSSKTSTPVNANFPEQLRSRSSRGGDGVSAAKRAPKKGGAASSVRHQPPSHSPPAESPRARGERGTSKTTATTRIKDDPLESAAPTGGEVTANREGEPGRADDDGDAEPAEAREDDEEAEVEEDEDDEGSSSLEPRYCYCNQVSYGSMVACDAKDCPREWFHLNCVGLTKPPGKNETWYCDECKAKLAAGKNTHQHQHPQQPPASSSNDTGLHSTSGNNAGSRSRGGSVRS